MYYSAQAIWSSITLNIIGVVGLLIAPILVGSFVDGYGLSLAQSGYVFAIFTLGIALSSITMYLIGIHLNQKNLRIYALVFAIAGWVILGLVKDFQVLLIVSGVTGFGCGLMSSANFALLHTTAKPGKNFTILLFFITASSALSLLGATYIKQAFGDEAVFFALAIISALALPLIFFIPPALKFSEPATTELNDEDDGAYRNKPIWLWLLMFFFTYVAFGVFWTYAERMGIEVGLSTEQVGTLFSVGIVLALLGSVVAYWLGERHGYARPLGAAFLTLGSIFITLALVPKAGPYIICILLFFFLWVMTDVLELGTLSSISKDGRYAALVPAFQAIGNVAGTSIGASLFALGLGFKSVMFLACGSIIFALILLYFVASKLN